MNKQNRGAFNSASNAKRSRLCPASRSRTKWMGEGPSNADADAGTEIHAAVETGDLSELNEHEASIAEQCENLFQKLLHDVSPKLNGVMMQGAEAKEVRYWNTTGGATFSGQADRVVVWKEQGHVLIADYKTGNVGSDPAESNDQLKALMACFIDEIDGDLNWVNKVTVAMIQPMKSPQVTHHDFVGFDQIDEAITESEAIFRKAELPGAEAHPGFDQCKYCRALNLCPEAEKQVERLALMGESTTGLISDPQKLARLLDVGEMAGKIHKANRETAKDLLLKDVNVPGWKIQTGKGRAVIETETVMGRLSEMGISSAALWKVVTITKTNLQKVLKLKTGTTGGALKQEVEHVLEDAVTEGSEIQKLVKA
jgi:hypothetical protein